MDRSESVAFSFGQRPMKSIRAKQRRADSNGSIIKSRRPHDTESEMEYEAKLDLENVLDYLDSVRGPPTENTRHDVDHEDIHLQDES